MSDDLSQRLGTYLGTKVYDGQTVGVRDLARIHGGASRETYRFRAQLPNGQERRLILRRDPEASLIDTERSLEFAAYRSFHGSGVPVPEPIALESDTAWLGRPFFVMAEIEESEAKSPFAPDPYTPFADQTGEAFWRILGRIAARPVGGSPLAEVADAPALEGAWSRELDYWESVLDTDELEPQPIARAAIRRLRRQPPPTPGRLTIVHGDYRSGNFLVGADGRIKAILDWEMAHIGDPHEDLAWALDPLWGHGLEGRPGGMIPTGDALSFWEDESGLRVDREALAWWRIFACIKGIAIWVSSAKEFAQGANIDPVLAFSGWYCSTRHNAILLDALGDDAPEGPTALGTPT